MSGLRFDYTRQPKLVRTSAGGSHSSYTLSVWFKNTSNQANNFLWVGGSSSYNVIGVSGAKFQVTNSDGGGNLDFDINSYNTNLRWTHYVLQKDGSSNQLKLYIDGALATTASSTSPLGNFDFDSKEVSIGYWKAANRYMEGYLSDHYLVVDEALEPEVFGKSFEGKWGPLDNAVVLENIKGKTKSPYQERPNMDEKWSDFGNPGNNYMANEGIDNLFDGSFSTWMAPQIGGTDFVEVDFTSLDLTYTKIELVLGKTGGATGSVLLNGQEINSNIIGAALPPAAGTLFDVTDWITGEKKLNTFRITNDNAAENYVIYAIILDGRILVDGPADNSQNWSDGWTSDSVFAPSVVGGQPYAGGPLGPFDSNRDQAASVLSTQAGGQPNHITWNTDLTGDFEIKYFIENGALFTYILDGVEKSITDLANWNAPGTKTFSGKLTQIKMATTETSTNNGAGLFYVKHNNKLLLDAGAQWDQSQVWSDYEVTGSTYFPGEGVDRLFDGSLSTWAAPGSNDPSKFFELDFTSLNLTYTKIELVLGASVGATGTVLLNNQDITTNITSPAVPPAVGKLYNATDWITGDKQLKTFKISNGGGSSNYVAYAIILDGEILVDAGTMGSNGFYLPFSDASDLGADYSGQDNDFTPSNFITTGAGQDPVKDTPMKNYAVHTGDGASNGNLVQTNITNANAKPTSVTFSADSKIYFESKFESGNFAHLGVGDGAGTYSQVKNDGSLTNLTLVSGSALTWSTGDTVGVTIDVAAKTMTLAKTQQDQNDKATYSLDNCAAGYSPFACSGQGVQVNNFGQQPFVFTPPAGYEGLYQTWEQYARTALGYALDRIAKLEQQRNYDLATIAELRTRVEEALARIGSIETNEVMMMLSTPCCFPPWQT